MWKHVLIEKNVYKLAKDAFTTLCLRENTFLGVDTHWLFGKEKISVTAIRKEGHADRLLEYEMTCHHWFPWKKV